MAVQKNQCIPLEITGLTSEGSGVGRYEGEAVFVPGTAPGDRITARIVKDCKRYAYGIVDKLEQPGPGRREEDCPICRPCGGCCFRHLTYEAELEAKKDIVLDAFRRIGGLELPIDQVLASPQEDRYRNKVQFPVQKDEQGHTIAGFYAGRSHRIIPCEDCLLQPAILNQIAQAVCSWMDENGVSPYDEASHTGLVRHIFLRRGTHSGQIMLCLVINGHSLPHSEAFCSAMLQQFPEIQTILLNVNTQRTNVITGLESIPLYGPGYIEDTMCGVPVRLGPLSFYQVNPPSAVCPGPAICTAEAHGPLAGPVLRHGHHWPFHGAGLRRSGGCGDHPRSGGECPAERRPHGSNRSLFVCRRRSGCLSAGRRGPCAGCNFAGSSPQRL